MIASERLCKLLDERGVEYEKTPWSCGAAVWWRDSSGTMWRAHDNEEDELLSFYAYNSLTPEQAIAATLGHSSNCTNSERTNAACKPITYDNGYSTDRLEPGEYHEFWEPACACGNCGELIPMRKFCPNCGSRLEVDA